MTTIADAATNNHGETPRPDLRVVGEQFGSDHFVAWALAWRKAGYPPLILGGDNGKKLLVKHITGYSPNDAIVAEIRSWPGLFKKQNSVNLGIRCPLGVVGIDVDAYDGKRGLTTLAECEAKWGALPPPYMTTARDDGSGIRWYRVPVGWTGHDPKAGDDTDGHIELIQRHHRYAVVPPSEHASGSDYRLYGPDGNEIAPGILPPPSELPELPQRWLDGLTSPTRAQGGRIAAADVDRWLDEWTANDYPSYLTQVTKRLQGELDNGADRHKAMFSALCWAFKEARAGGYCARAAHDELKAQWDKMIRDPDDGRHDEAEFDRMVRDGINAAEADDHAKRWLRMHRNYGEDTRDNSDVKGLLDRVKTESQSAGGQPPRFVGVTAAELAAPVTPMRWLVRGVWPQRSAGVLAGEKKTFKTWNLQAMAIAVAAGVPFLGQFDVSDAKPVLYLCGEGGRDAFANRHQVIAARYGITLDDLAGLPFIAEFDTDQLDNADLINGIKRHLDNLQPALVVLDPLYAYHPANVEASNLYARGPMLAKLRELIENHAALAIGDHFKKSTSDAFDLDNISMAGVAQWADTWVLQRHRADPNLIKNDYQLEVEFSTRRGGGWRWEIDWHLDRDDTDPDVVAWKSCNWKVNPPANTNANTPERDLELRIARKVYDSPWTMTRDDLHMVVGGRKQPLFAAVKRLLDKLELGERKPNKGRAMLLGPGKLVAPVVSSSAVTP
ncbi:AAA family ATPase [Mycobacterium paraffinicum]|uniref:AAA family ATPase n=1 Tax=Mycobacterium paraffinicum TaxID=53378 RepID=UPI00093AD9F0|nr:AAA family ATPase [Mycobacterium paraffinicum]